MYIICRNVKRGSLELGWMGSIEELLQWKNCTMQEITLEGIEDYISSIEVRKEGRDKSILEYIKQYKES